VQHVGGLAGRRQQGGDVFDGFAQAEGGAVVGRLDLAVLQRHRRECADVEAEHVGVFGGLRSRGFVRSLFRSSGVGGSGSRLRARTSRQHRARQQQGQRDGKRGSLHGSLGCGGRGPIVSGKA